MSNGIMDLHAYFLHVHIHTCTNITHFVRIFFQADMTQEMVDMEEQHTTAMATARTSHKQKIAELEDTMAKYQVCAHEYINVIFTWLYKL